MMEPAGATGSIPRAFLRIGGNSLARHQLGLALAMDCQRVICLARGLDAELITLQHDAERANARFHVVAGSRALAGLITAHDDLLVLSEGLLAEPQAAIALLEPGNTVLVQPVEAGVAAGYERIDLNHAAAGAIRIPGRLVERLQELPADCDVPSALVRIALQAGVPMQEVPATSRGGTGWRLIRDENEAHAAETDWIRLHMGQRLAPTPVTLLTRLALRSLGPSLLHAGSGSKVAAAGTLAALLIGLGAGWLGFAALGFLFLALAAVLRECTAALERIEQASLSLPLPQLSLDVIFGWLIDFGLIAMTAWSVPPSLLESASQRAFAPLMLVMLARLLPRISERMLAPWVEDRALLATLLAIAAGFGVLLGSVQLLAVLLALGGLLFPGGKLRLT